MVHRHRNYNPKKRPLTIEQQIANMRANFPHFRVHQHRNKAAWIGFLTPTPMSASYNVKIEYQIGYHPRVFVLSPLLELESHGQKLKHIFADNQLCLYLPESDEWSGTKVIVDTIMPWIALWLFHYEIWLATGEWYGGGVHPEKKIPYRKIDDEKTRKAC